MLTYRNINTHSEHKSPRADYARNEHNQPAEAWHIVYHGLLNDFSHLCCERFAIKNPMISGIYEVFKKDYKKSCKPLILKEKFS